MTSQQVEHSGKMGEEDVWDPSMQCLHCSCLDVATDSCVDAQLLISTQVACALPISS